MFDRKKLQREKESLETELLEARATIRKLRKRLRKRDEHIKSIREWEKPSNVQGRRRIVTHIVHDERKFVYFWIHKVASSSVKAALLPLFDIDPTPFERTLKDGTQHFAVHPVFNASDYQISKERLLSRLDYEYRDYFKFAFVRNPWDRLVSCYVDKVMRLKVPPTLLGSAAYVNLEFYPNMPFAEFAETVCQIPDEVADGHLRSQHLTVCGPDGDLVVDFVGRFENLREDFAHVTQEIRAPGMELPERNRKSVSKRGSRHYRDFYHERTKDLVQKRYEKDVETFGYSF